jgi:flagellar basal-body rod protein FlgC
MYIGNPFGISLSALNAYMTRMNVTANNIANLNTEGFRPSKAIINDSGSGGVYVNIRQSAIPEVDLAKEMTDLMVTEAGFKANLKTVSTGDEVIKSILDIMA